MIIQKSTNNRLYKKPVAEWDKLINEAGDSKFYHIVTMKTWIGINRTMREFWPQWHSVHPSRGSLHFWVWNANFLGEDVRQFRPSV